jgi:N-acetylglucosaminyl-diphospho-decaprenol L-rhamnosyltransferase
MPRPYAAVVIVNYRTEELTDRCLYLLDGAADGLALERIVVDNASNDGSAARLRDRHPRAVVVERPTNDGFAAGVNAGFAASEAPYVVLLNPDTEPQPRAISRLVEHLRRNPRVAVAAPVLLRPDGTVQRSAHRRFPSLLTLFVDFCVPAGYALARRPELHPHELSERRTAQGGLAEHVNGSALAIRRAAYEEAGGFDEGFFMYMEETEWQQRVRRCGWMIEVVPEAEVVHMTRAGESMSAITERYLPSVYRYMRMQGHREWSVSAVLMAATLLSRAALRAIAALSSSRRDSSLELLEFHRSVARYVWTRRRGR